MASEADFLTTQKNGVVAINATATALASQNTQNKYLSGQYTSAALSAQTLVAKGTGYLVNVSITVAGSAAGTVNNAATTGAAAAANALVVTPATVGVFPVGARFNAGLVVTPGAGQSVVVTYSLD